MVLLKQERHAEMTAIAPHVATARDSDADTTMVVTATLAVFALNGSHKFQRQTMI